MKYLEDVLIAPVISEKSYDRIADSNSYTFFVHPKTDKPQIKKAVEQMFDVNVLRAVSYTHLTLPTILLV